MVKNIYSTGTPHEKIQHYDVLILGGGPAGLTAALYAGRYNLSTAVVAKNFGGTAAMAGEIENWPGMIGSGIELMKKFQDHSAKFGARFLQAEVDKISKDNNGFVLTICDKEIHGKTLIICLGTEHRRLNIPGEKEFLGKGVSYCATCDGMFFKNKEVAVVGGADSAAKAALYLSELAKKVHIIYRRDQMRCEPIMLKKINKQKNVEVHYFSEPKKIEGEATVKKLTITINDPDKKPVEKILHLDGVFVSVGATPVNEVVKELRISLDKKDQIITDKKARTNVPEFLQLATEQTDISSKS